MIEANELRKGNWVKCTAHLPIGYHSASLPFVRISEIKSLGVETDAGAHTYRDIAPIILTEELLINAGGQKTKDDLILFVDFDTDTTPLSIFKGEDGFYMGNIITKVSMSIKSVHHFQNLYYILKGKEIKIKL